MKDNYEIVKFIDDEIELDVNVSPCEDNIWLSKNQLAILFDRDRSVISKHIKKIFNDNECDKTSNVQKMHVANSDKLVEFYSLDIIISVGFKTNSKKAIIFRKWANNVLKEYLLRGYVINENRVIISNENYIELRNEVATINNRLLKIEDKVFDKEYGLDKIFYNGEFYDAYTLIQQIFESANNEIIIFDNYVDRTVLDRLIVKKNNVNVIIYTNIHTKLLVTDKNNFNSQYGGLTIKHTTNVHDRYIVIDRKKLYHLGHSIKDLGKKIFSISESDNRLIDKLLNYI